MTDRGVVLSDTRTRSKHAVTHDSSLLRRKSDSAVLTCCDSGHAVFNLFSFMTERDDDVENKVPNLISKFTRG